MHFDILSSANIAIIDISVVFKKVELGQYCMFK